MRKPSDAEFIGRDEIVSYRAVPWKMPNLREVKISRKNMGGKGARPQAATTAGRIPQMTKESWDIADGIAASLRIEAGKAMSSNIQRENPMPVRSASATLDAWLIHV